MIYVITACFILLDLITGIVKSFKEKNYCSTVMREGLYHKGGSILCAVFGFLVDHAQDFIDLGVRIPIANSVCIYICIMEIGSIIENVGRINPEILPEKLQSFFSKLSNK